MHTLEPVAFMFWNEPDTQRHFTALKEAIGSHWAHVVPLYTAPPLTCDFAQSYPGGKIDDSSFEKIEGALDKIEAPAQGLDGKWLSLHERIEALAAQGGPQT